MGTFIDRTSIKKAVSKSDRDKSSFKIKKRKKKFFCINVVNLFKVDMD